MSGAAMAGARHIRWADLPMEQLSPTLGRRMAWGERVMVAQVTLTRGAVIPTHQHVHEQFSCVLSGALEFTVGGTSGTTVVRAGEVLQLPSNVPHGATVLEDSIVLDVFSPPREDWIDGSDAYLRSATR